MVRLTRARRPGRQQQGSVLCGRGFVLMKNCYTGNFPDSNRGEGESEEEVGGELNNR